MLYAIAGATERRGIQIYAISLPSGELVGERQVAGIAGKLVPAPSGVWLSYRGGMLGTALLLSPRDLTTRSPTPAHVWSTWPNVQPPLPGTMQGMGTQVIVTGDTAWLSALGGIACADASTGRVRAVAKPGNFGIIGAVGHRLYAFARDSSSRRRAHIVEVEAPAACWG